MVIRPQSNRRASFELPGAPLGRGVDALKSMAHEDAKDAFEGLRLPLFAPDIGPGAAHLSPATGTVATHINYAPHIWPQGPHAGRPSDAGAYKSIAHHGAVSAVALSVGCLAGVMLAGWLAGSYGRKASKAARKKLHDVCMA